MNGIPMLKVWSASMPISLDENGDVVVKKDARPWNGRRLKRHEILACAEAYGLALACTGEEGLAAQAAYEFLSTLPGADGCIPVQ